MRVWVSPQMADCGGLPQVVQVGFLLHKRPILKLKLPSNIFFFVMFNFCHFPFVYSQGNLLRPSSTLFREWATVSIKTHVLLESVSRKYQNIR